ncbi:conoporin-Cn1 isoform X2 [Lepeophtheirus salmonis]|uniref:conoporin-Cn1 isoform X2 n=1 Tax=Lepeophtheirus salmonis TaxID=72036 RepID=UPI001AE9D860|nr:conoporin-Cn1-like [Lepeophtheirus salmonis]
MMKWIHSLSSSAFSSSAASLSVFLIRCLILATAYDERFVSQLLSNRSVIENGGSLNGTSLQNLRYNSMTEYSVRCLINIENWTAWKLKDALAHNHCGYIHSDFQAPNVEPAFREVMLGHKHGGTATGTCGTVSWQIEHLDTRLIVMWSVPFNFNLHDSYFAVGMIFNRGRFTSSSYWFNQMYYSEKGPYKRGSGGQSVTFQNSAVLVHGYMEPSSYHPLVNISVIPQVRYKLAPQIWKKLYTADRFKYTGSGNKRTLCNGILPGSSGPFAITVGISISLCVISNVYSGTLL